MASLDLTAQDIYKDVRQMLRQCLTCDVVQGYQNNVPLPTGNFVLMHIVNAQGLATHINQYDGASSQMGVTQFIQLTMQLDFYGPQADVNARIAHNLFRDVWACEKLTVCQPLNASDPRLMPLENDSRNYEMRWTFEVELQYNPQVTTDQQFFDEAAITAILANA